MQPMIIIIIIIIIPAHTRHAINASYLKYDQTSLAHGILESD